MGRLRLIAASYWTELGLGLLAAALHMVWYMVGRAPGAEVVSGFGAALVVLGVWIGSRPYRRAGIAGLVEAGLPDGGAGPLGGPVYEAAERKLRDDARPQVTRDVWSERVIAVAVVILGTLLNGYGPLIARLLHLQGS